MKEQVPLTECVKQKLSGHHETAISGMPALRLRCQSAGGWLTGGTLPARTWEPQLTSRNGGTAVGECGALAPWALSRGRPGRQFAVLLEPLGTEGDCTESADWVGTQCTLSSVKRISWEFSTHTAGGFDMERQGEGGVGMCGLYLLDNKAVRFMFRLDSFPPSR